MNIYSILNYQMKNDMCYIKYHNFTTGKNTLDFNVQSSDYVLNDNIPVFLDFIHPAFLLLNNPGSNAIRAIADS